MYAKIGYKIATKAIQRLCVILGFFGIGNGGGKAFDAPGFWVHQCTHRLLGLKHRLGVRVFPGTPQGTFA